MNNTEDDYRPYGPEWDKEIKKLTKAQIIGILKEVGTRQEADAEESLEYRNTLHNCLSTFEFYAENYPHSEVANKAIAFIKATLLKYE